MARLTKPAVEKALLEHHGILLKAAEALQCSRQALYNFLERFPELNAVREEASERLVDVAESHLASALQDGDMKTIRWYMERKGKNRGYTTRVEQTGMDGGPIEFGVPEYDVVEPISEPEDGNNADA